MSDQLQKSLVELLSAEPDLKAISIFDRDGLVLSQVQSSDCPTELLEPWLSSTFQISCEQVDCVI
jgi:hypothetical protein